MQAARNPSADVVVDHDPAGELDEEPEMSTRNGTGGCPGADEAEGSHRLAAENGERKEKHRSDHVDGEPKRVHLVTCENSALIQCRPVALNLCPAISTIPSAGKPFRACFNEVKVEGNTSYSTC